MISKFFYSLIIPCYNEEETIEEVIKKSKNHVDEIIVVDDASTDKTSRLLKNMDDILLVKNKERLGQEKSIERGIRESSGDIILLMDADMEHNPLDIPRFKKYFIENKFDLIIGKRKKIPRVGEKKLNRLFLNEYKIDDAMNGFRLFRKSVFDEIGFYYKNNYFGIDFLIEALKNYKVGQIEISEKKRRKNPRIGTDEKINHKLEEIIKHVKKEFENERT